MFELELDGVLQTDVPVFKPVPKHQAVERDIALVVDEKLSHAALMVAIWAAPTGGLLRDANLFDIYRPLAAKGLDTTAVASFEKSVAVRLTLNSEEATLTEDQIDTAVKAVLSSVEGTLGARRRA
jgi:phenylalanyl-tRNA synthetase beta chain